MSPRAIQQIRRQLQEDTRTFGQRFGRSGRTVESWEQGVRTPDPLVIRELERIVKARRLAIME